MDFINVNLSKAQSLERQTVDFGVLETSVLHLLLGEWIREILLVFISGVAKLLLTGQLTMNQCINMFRLQSDLHIVVLKL